jgi:hypothetical protein
MCAKPDWLFSDEKTFHTFGSNAKRPPKWVDIVDTYHVSCYKNDSSKLVPPSW